MIARLIKGSRKRQSITEPTDQQPTDQQEALLAQDKQAPSTSGRVVRIRFNLGLNSSSKDHHKVAKPSFSLPESWWASYYLRSRSEDVPRIVSRSDKHDYRNPESNYPEDIVDALRRSHLEDAEKLDLQQRVNPFLSKDFLKTLQRFGLFPVAEDDEDEEEQHGDDEELEPIVEIRIRTASDASNSASQEASIMNDQVERSERRSRSFNDTGDASDNPNEATPSFSIANLPRRKWIRQRIRRWTITSVTSIRSLSRLRTVSYFHDRLSPIKVS